MNLAMEEVVQQFQRLSCVLINLHRHFLFLNLAVLLREDRGVCIRS